MTGLVFLYFVAPFLALLVGYAVGRTVELLHLRRIELREARLAHIPWSNLKQVPGDWRVTDSGLVGGQAVIGSDYFKTYASGIRSFFGGRVRSLETVMQRARREALLRMLEEAEARGANAVWNVRLETSDIASNGGSRRAIVAAEVHAYGTALRVES